MVVTNRPPPSGGCQARKRWTLRPAFVVAERKRGSLGGLLAAVEDGEVPRRRPRLAR